MSKGHAQRLDKGPFRSDGTQYTAVLRNSYFQSTNSAYDIVRLKPSGHLVADFAIQAKAELQWEHGTKEA